MKQIIGVGTSMEHTLIKEIDFSTEYYFYSAMRHLFYWPMSNIITKCFIKA